MHDLALALGMPTGLLSRLMSERELARWIGYMRKRKLPQFRVEMYLAQICQQIVQMMSGSDKPVPLQPFVIDFATTGKRKRKPKPPPEDDDDDGMSDAELEELKKAIGFKPRLRAKHGA